MTDREKVVFCRDAFLVLDNIAFFAYDTKTGSADTFKVVDTDSKRKMTVQISNGIFTVIDSSMCEASYYKALYYMEVNKQYITREVLKHAKVH